MWPAVPVFTGTLCCLPAHVPFLPAAAAAGALPSWPGAPCGPQIFLPSALQCMYSNARAHGCLVTSVRWAGDAVSILQQSAPQLADLPDTLQAVRNSTLRRSAWGTGKSEKLLIPIVTALKKCVLWAVLVTQALVQLPLCLCHCGLTHSSHNIPGAMHVGTGWQQALLMGLQANLGGSQISHGLPVGRQGARRRGPPHTHCSPPPPPS